jgi:hypothetical protein
MPAARMSASSTARFACSSSPCAIATRARVVSACDKCQPHVAETASSAKPRAVSTRNLKDPGANGTPVQLSFIQR